MSIPLVFEELNRFGFVHHRALNSRAAFQAASEAAQERPDLIHILEGDLCWHFDGAQKEFYFRHPDFLTDVLSLQELDAAREHGTLFGLQEIIDSPDPNLRYIIELKTGIGDLTQVMKELAGILQEKLRNRYWLDGFSLRQLRAVKIVDPEVPTSLHTKMVFGDFVLRTAPEFFPLSIHRIRNLLEIDAITLTYKTSLAHWFKFAGATINSTCEKVISNGKVLILGGLTSPDRFLLAAESMAKAGYAKFPLSDLPVL